MNEHLNPIFKRVLDDAVRDLLGYVEDREKVLQRKLQPHHPVRKVARDLQTLSKYPKWEGK